MRSYSKQRIDEKADMVLRGYYGNDEYRRRTLGADYNAVQQRVNQIIDDYARDVMRGRYGNGRERQRRLGHLYPAVQARVNEVLRGNW